MCVDVSQGSQKDLRPGQVQAKPHRSESSPTGWDDHRGSHFLTLTPPHQAMEMEVTPYLNQYRRWQWIPLLNPSPQ